MEDVGFGGAAEAQHVGEVLGQLEGAAAGGAQTAGGAATVEALPHLVALGWRHRSVEKTAGQQLDLGAATGPRRGGGTVVGGREGRGDDQVDTQCGRVWVPP